MSLRIPIGKLVKPIGLTGRFKIDLYTKGSQTLKAVRALHFAKDGRDLGSFKIEEVALKKDSAAVSVQGIKARDAVSGLLGAQVFVDSGELPKLRAREYYHYELIGSRVLGPNKKYLGDLMNIVETKAHDVWCIVKDGKEFMIPAVDKIVRRVDVKNKIINIDPEGLIDA